jgi:undecaprenyl-diphosphatase
LNIINTIKDLDTQLFLFLNSKHNEFFDVPMYWLSNKIIWIPLYIYFFYLAFKKVSNRVWLIAIAVALLILLSDQLSVHAFKNVFLRYRPCHNLLLQSKIHLLNGYCGGTYGFVSSHAANTFALAMFLSLLFKNKIKNFTILIFIWASLVSYSRIYSGVHYPADVAVAAILGMGIGVMVFKIYEYANTRMNIKNLTNE